MALISAITYRLPRSYLQHDVIITVEWIWDIRIGINSSKNKSDADFEFTPQLGNCLSYFRSLRFLVQWVSKAVNLFISSFSMISCKVCWRKRSFPCFRRFIFESCFGV